MPIRSAAPVTTSVIAATPIHSGRGTRTDNRRGWGLMGSVVMAMPSVYRRPMRK